MHFSLYRWTLIWQSVWLLNTEYHDQFASAEFYAPSYVQMEVLDTLTQKYVNYYRQMHMNPK
jgi:hypothetical protein